ncbi:MAG: hypothetical protein AB2A00_28480 [Myxococcota bacterium]
MDHVALAGVLIVGKGDVVRKRLAPWIQATAIPAQHVADVQEALTILQPSAKHLVCVDEHTVPSADVDLLLQRMNESSPLSVAVGVQCHSDDGGISLVALVPGVALATQGVARLLFETQEFEEDALLRSAVRVLVGRWTVRSVLAAVREIMVEEALSRAAGNLTRAASLLQVTRQAIQARRTTHPRAPIPRQRTGTRNGVDVRGRAG